MRIHKIPMKAHLAGILIFLAGFASCELYDTSSTDYILSILIECSGGTAQTFSFDFVADDYVLSQTGNVQAFLPLNNIKTISVTATKDAGDAAIQIFILKDEKVVMAGTLNGNSPSSLSPTNTLTVVWKNTEENKDESDTTTTKTTSNTSGT